MKASEHGQSAPEPEWVWSLSEDGDGDGVWHSTAGSREEAVAEIKNACEEEGHDFHGYVGEVEEADVSTPDADRLLEQMGENAYEELGEAAEDWPRANREQVADLQRRIDHTLAEWLTTHNLWPRFFKVVRVSEVTVIDLPAGHDGDHSGGGPVG